MGFWRGAWRQENGEGRLEIENWISLCHNQIQRSCLTIVAFINLLTTYISNSYEYFRSNQRRHSFGNART